MWENFARCIIVKMIVCSNWLGNDWALTNHGQQLPLSAATRLANLSAAHPLGHSHLLKQKNYSSILGLFWLASTKHSSFPVCS